MNNPIVHALSSRRTTLIVLGGVATLIAAILVIAPNEAVLGSGIKTVYIHAALIWTGMAGFVIKGVLGLGLLLLAQAGLTQWSRTMGWVAMAFFAAGLAMSIWAAKVNWGAVFWQEPRNQAGANVLMAALVVQIVHTWPVPVRLKGAMDLLLVGYMGWAMYATPLVMHPRNPVQSSPSLAIQLTFYALFGLCAVGGIWIALHLNRLQTPADSHPTPKETP